MEHCSLEDAFVELKTYADKIVAENSDLKAHVTHLETTLEMHHNPYNTTDINVLQIVVVHEEIGIAAELLDTTDSHFI